MPCPPPANLRERLASSLAICRAYAALLRRQLAEATAALALSRSRWRTACAALLGFCLMAPGRLAFPSEPVPCAVVAAEEEAPDWSTVDVGPVELLAGKKPHRLPRSEEAPEHWRREPCPKTDAVRVVHGVCYDVLKATPKGVPPECERGIPHGGECLMPMPKPPVTSFQRTP